MALPHLNVKFVCGAQYRVKAIDWRVVGCKRLYVPEEQGLYMFKPPTVRTINLWDAQDNAQEGT